MALLRAPRWQGLVVTPPVLALLMVLPVALSLLVERLAIPGPAEFYAPALALGWFTPLVLLWACWWLAPAGQRPAPLALFGMLCALSVPILVVVGLVWVPLQRMAGPDGDESSATAAWLGWGFVAWQLAAQLRLVARSSRAATRLRLAGTLLLTGLMAQSVALELPRPWYPKAPPREARAAPWQPTQAAFEAQAAALQNQLERLAPQREGRTDVFVLVFAPYADEDVFKREAAMVADVMGERFDAQGRTLQLVNHRDTAATLPWATPLNLERAIAAVAARMDLAQDILFLHLTSHGARDGELAAEFGTLRVEPVTPALLRRALDAAGVRHRIVSISACYSGSWIEPLKGDHTLVMTAADATHTSYGCGRASELTFFGRALYDEALRRDTRSFEAAHAQAREVIEKREIEAGKKDGYSNPQIATGSAMRDQLAAWQRELEAGR